MERLDIDAAVVDGRVVAPATVVIDEGLIRAAGPPATIGDLDAPTTRLAGTLVPGFVDLQVNGFAGHQYGDAASGLGATSTALLRSGVTALCPTITSRSWDAYPSALESLVVPAAPTAPRNLGVHLEGPFLDPDHAGAHDRGALVGPTPERLEQLLSWVGGRVAIVTLAPELDGAGAVITRLREAGIVVSAGHTGATYDQLRAAVDLGVTMVTHVFNAQRGMGHREPGTAGGALLLDALTVGIILDGHHVHPDLAAMVLERAAGRVIAVTDAVATAGLPRGRHEISGVLVDTSDGAPRLADGTLAGSNLTMDEAFRFVAKVRGLDEAVAATATTPARALGRGELGRIAEGAVADMVLLDGDLRVAGVWCDGTRAVG